MHLTEEQVAAIDRLRAGMARLDLPSLQTPAMACIAPTIDPDKVYQSTPLDLIGGHVIEWNGQIIARQVKDAMDGAGLDTSKFLTATPMDAP